MLWAILAAVFFAAIVLVWMTELHRRKSRTLRFSGRDLIEIQDIVKTSFPQQQEISDLLIYWWGKAASILRIDGRLLRSDDRFDGVLSRIRGFPTEDESDELCEIIEEISPDSHTKLALNPLETFGECVLFLAIESGKQETKKRRGQDGSVDNLDP